MTETLVASGFFRVDRTRALAVLRRHQLEDPRDFLVPWLRLAAASQAGGVELFSQPRGLALGYEGRDIPRRLLEDPFECLFGDEERSPLLVAGILGVLRLEPRRLIVRSGEFRFSIDRYERQSVAALPGAEGTCLEVAWAGWFTRGRTRECLRRARAAQPAVGVPLWIDGRA